MTLADKTIADRVDMGAKPEPSGRFSPLDWLLVFVPIAIAVEHFAPERHLLIFASSSLGLLPLAALMSRATENLAERMGEGVGGLLNATFGNAAELIIAIVALQAGLPAVVEASIVGSIVGNMLLVLGAAMLAGGITHSEQQFNPVGARSEATMLVLAAIALVVPAAFEARIGTTEGLHQLSICMSIVLLIVYGLYLIYSLITHSAFFRGSHLPGQKEAATMSPAVAAAILAVATVGTAWMSEIMVGSLEPTVEDFGLSDVFLGAFAVAILGNAAEHASAITAALKNRMDLSLSIAIGSSVQVALFVAPVLVLVSLFVGPTPMDLAFRLGLVVSVLLSVWITGQVAGDGRSDWLKGVQLLTVYFSLALAFFFLPA